MSMTMMMMTGLEGVVATRRALILSEAPMTTTTTTATEMAPTWARSERRCRFGKRDVYYEDDENEDDGDEDDSSSSEEGSDQDLPLHERIQRKERRGLLASTLNLSRERKSRALEVASERLATLQRRQPRKENSGNSGTLSSGGKIGKRSMADDDGDKGGEDVVPASAPAGTTKKKKKSKHRPTEVSSKRADFFRRGAPKLNESGLGVELGAHRYKPHDPRLSSLTGHFDEERFQKDYAFLEDLRNQEIGQIRKRVAAWKATGDRGRRLRRKLGITAINENAGSLEEDEARLKSLTQDRAALERQKVERAAKQSVKRRIQDEVASGRRGAYFLKRKEKKRLEMEAKLEEIRKRGGEKAVEKMLDRKRRKNKSRDAGMFAK
jgi:ribosomal RNA-processing protein 36